MRPAPFIAAFILALVTVLAVPLAATGSLESITGSAAGILRVVTQLFAITALFFIAITSFQRIAPKVSIWIQQRDAIALTGQSAVLHPFLHLALTFDRRAIIRAARVVFLFQLPYLLLLFPGSMTNDPMLQLFQALGSGAAQPEIYGSTATGAFSDSHPLFHTLLIGVLFRLGALTGFDNMGVVAICLFQLILNAFAFATAACYLERLQVPKTLRRWTLMFFALFPLFGLYGATVFKDIIFSALYLFYFLFIIETARTRGSALQSRQFVLLFALASVLMALTKKPGIYLAVATALILLVLYRKQWRGLIVVTLAPSAIGMLLIPLLLFPLLQVVPGGRQEMYALFLQQTARTVVKHSDDVTVTERETINSIIPYDSIDEVYLYYSTDPIKGRFNQEATTKETLEYFGVWVSQFMRHPLTYLEATGGVIGGYFTPTVPFDYFDMQLPYDHVEYIEQTRQQTGADTIAAQLDIGSPDSLVPLKKAYRALIEGLWDLPGFNVVFSMAAYTLWIPLIGFVFIRQGRRELLPIFVPIAFSLVILCISPYGMERYALPFLFTSPLIVPLVLAQATITDAKEPLATQRALSSQGVRYVVTGAASALLELLVFLGLFEILGTPVVLANVAALLCSTAFNFKVNHSWSFASTARLSKSLVKYLILFAFNLCFSSLALFFLVGGGVPSFFAKLATMACIVSWNFVLYRKVVFK